MAAAQPTADIYTRELRIAPVMTGGTSLAVWMGGVTAELYRMLMARRDDRPATRIYRELLDLTRTDPRVDVITGTSAGGLNGSLLAAAWFLNLPTDRFMAMRSIWLELGDLGALLRSPNESNPPSLLRGDDYFAKKLREVLAGWSAYDRGRGEFRPLDLLITVTTVRGEPAYSFDDFGQKIGEVSHRQHLQFVRDGPDDHDRDDFRDERWIDRLATASRTSASIPGVFEPSFLVVEGSKSDGDTSGRPTYAKEQASFSVSRWAVDGGVTVNLPLGEAIDRIFRQRAARDLRRVVLYVKPTPTVPAEARAERAGDMPTIADAIQTTSKAPRAEGITGDIGRIRDHNERASHQRIARLARLRITDDDTVDIAAQAQQLWPAFMLLRSLKSVDLMLAEAAPYLNVRAQPRQLDIEAALREPRAGVMPANADCTKGATTGSPWGWGISALEYGISLAMGMLSTAFDLPQPRVPDARDESLRAQLCQPWEALHQLLAKLRLVRGVDDAYWRDRVRRLVDVDDQSQLKRWATDAYRQWPFAVKADGTLDAPQPTEIDLALQDLEHAEGERFRRATGAESTVQVLSYLRDLGRRLGSVVVDMNTTLRELTELVLRDVATTVDPTFNANSEVDDIIRTLRTRLRDSYLHPGEDDALPARAIEVVQPILGLVTQLTQIVPAPSRAPKNRAAVASACLQNILRLHVLDTVYQGEATTNEQILELLQVSWDAPNALDPRPPESKLAGTEVARLGAFLKRSWRANDWMWGRLDGAQRMIVMLLDPKRLRQLRYTGDDVFARIDGLMIGNGGDPANDAWDAESQKLAREQLNFLDDDALPTPQSLPACTAALTYALQTVIAQEELPYVHDALVVTEREGGAEGAEDAFRVLYRRKVQKGTGADGSIDDQIAPADAPVLLRAVRIGDEHAGDEIGHDLFTRTATQAAAVVVKAATGDRAGVPLVSRAARPLRTPAVVLYALGRVMTMRSRTAVALLAIALSMSGALLGLRIAQPEEVNGPVTVVAALVFLTALGLALLRSRLWTAVPTLVAATIVVLAIVGTDVGDLLFDELPPHPPSQPEWKRVLFTDTWSVAFVLALLTAVMLSYAFGRRVVDHWRLRPTASVTPRQWAAIDRSRYVQLFRRGVLLGLLAPVTLLTFQWLMEQLVLGTKGQEPVKDWIYDAADFLQEQKLWVVALTVAALGALIGIGYDRLLSQVFARGWRLVRRPFVALAWRGERDQAPDAKAQQPLPHPFSRMTSAQRWATFTVAIVAVIGLAVAMQFMGGSVPQLTDNFHISRTGSESTVWLLVVDYPFMVAYGLAGALALAWFASLWSSQAAETDRATRDVARSQAEASELRTEQVQLASNAKAAALVAWLPLAAAACDSMENAFLLGYLGGRPDWTASVSSAFSIAKWALLALAGVVLLVEAIGYRLALPDIRKRIKTAA